MSAAPRIKICGLRRPQDVRVAVAAGADFIGFVLADGARRVTSARARELHEAVSGELGERTAGARSPRPVAVLVDEPVSNVLRESASAGIRTVQLHGNESPEACRALREAGLVVWKALRPRSLDDLRQLVARYRDVVDALHVEGWSARAPGGTGSGFPWEWIDALRHEMALPGPRGAGGVGEEFAAHTPESANTFRQHPELILAGGLTPDNVGEAIRRVRPDMVDVSSGVEVRPGVKDAALVRAFVRRARGSPGGTSWEDE